MCTRFLYGVLPAELYWNDQTLKRLNGFFVDNLNQLFYEGVCVTWPSSVHFWDQFSV